MKKLGIILPLLAGFAAIPANAQDLGVTFRAEARVGYDEVRSDLTVQSGTFNGDFGTSGVMFGGEVGVDARIFEGVAVGAYAGGEFSQVDNCVDRPFTPERTAASRNDRVCVEADHNLYVGGRLGIPVGEGGLVYGKGGYSRARFNGSYVNTPLPTTANPNPTPQQLFSGRDTVDGYHFGGGFELGLTSGLYVRGEYVQHRYDDAFTRLLNTTGTPPTDPGRRDRFDPRRHQLVFAIGFRFGGGRR